MAGVITEVDEAKKGKGKNTARKKKTPAASVGMGKRKRRVVESTSSSDDEDLALTFQRNYCFGREASGGTSKQLVTPAIPMNVAPPAPPPKKAIIDDLQGLFDEGLSLIGCRGKVMSSKRKKKTPPHIQTSEQSHYLHEDKWVLVDINDEWVLAQRKFTHSMYVVGRWPNQNPYEMFDCFLHDQYLQLYGMIRDAAEEVGLKEIKAPGPITYLPPTSLWSQFMHALRRELSEGLRPLHETFIALIHLYGSKAHATRGLEILAAMEKLNYDIRQALLLLVEELVKSMHLEYANRVFLKGAEGGLRATDKLYDLLIEEDCKVGDHSNALTIAYEMEAAGRMATSFHFNCLLSVQATCRIPELLSPPLKTWNMEKLT
ncbi:hypothetical protein ACS0TY_003615 [Phlomoides rotata]